MKYIKAFNNSIDRETYMKSKFVSPHLFLNKQNIRDVHYLEEYIPLEYISSTSTGMQYIDLNIKLYETLNTWYDIAIKYNVIGKGPIGISDGNNQPTLFGCQNQASPYPGTFIRMNQDSVTNTTGRYIGGTNKDNTLENNNTIIELPVRIAPNKNVTNLNNSGKTHNWGTSLFCAFHDENRTPFRFIEAKLYYFKLFLKADSNSQGVLVRDMIPCKNSKGVVGLFDKVNYVFYTSPNGAEFVAGPTLENDKMYNILYLESTGTQWINTLIHPTTGYGFELYGGFTNFTNSEFFGGGNNFDNGLGICTHNGGKYGIIVGTTEVCQISAENNVMHLFKVNSDGTVYVDNEYKGQSTTLMPDGNYTMNIFRHSSTKVPLSAKIYYCKIFDNNDNLVFDGVPVCKNGIGYMYDKVTKQLFENNGTGNFILGPNI